MSTPALTQAVLRTLSPREEKVMKMRHGLEDGVQHSVASVALSFALPASSIEKIEAAALRKLRHPSRSSHLR